MTPEAALAALRAGADPERAAEMAAYHKTDRETLGLAMAQIDAVVKSVRAETTDTERLPLAAALWESGVFEARLAAAKIVTRARIKDAAAEQATWDLIASWVPQFDGWRYAFAFGKNPNLLASNVLVICSGGRNGPDTNCHGEEHNVAPFVATDYNQDIVWADGYMVSWPGQI